MSVAWSDQGAEVSFVKVTLVHPTTGTSLTVREDCPEPDETGQRQAMESALAEGFVVTRRWRVIYSGTERRTEELCNDPACDVPPGSSIETTCS